MGMGGGRRCLGAQENVQTVLSLFILVHKSVAQIVQLSYKIRENQKKLLKPNLCIEKDHILRTIIENSSKIINKRS